MSSHPWILGSKTKRWLALAALFSLTSACGGGSLNHAETMYASGDYVGAAEVLEHTQSRLSSCSPQERAQYALYRGATLLSLGDIVSARHWTGVASRLNRQDPQLLSDSERSMLQQVEVRVERAHQARSAGSTLEGQRLATVP